MAHVSTEIHFRFHIVSGCVLALVFADTAAAESTSIQSKLGGTKLGTAVIQVRPLNSSRLIYRRRYVRRLHTAVPATSEMYSAARYAADNDVCQHSGTKKNTN